ncbi:MAG: hypothetical protein PHH46_05930 [Firmicutes bacterium]|nr:hypothetical protein [Bacillota bacterium]
MKLPDINMKVVLVSVAVATVLLFGGREVLMRTSVTMPMEKAFASMSEIESYKIERLPYGTVVDISLRNAGDLSETVRKIEAATSKLPAGGGLWVRITDTRDALLQDVYHRIHFDIQEAIATGSFSELRRRADEEAQRAGLSDCAIYVDIDHVYITLEDGEHELYAVSPRIPQLAEGEATVGQDIRWLSSRSPVRKAGADR